MKGMFLRSITDAYFFLVAAVGFCSDEEQRTELDAIRVSLSSFYTKYIHHE